MKARLLVEEQTDAVPVLQIYGHTSPITGLVLSKYSAQVYSSSRDGTVKLWDLLNGSELSAISLTSPINAMVIVIALIEYRIMQKNGSMLGVMTSVSMPFSKEQIRRSL
jgi:WD40 repeat protein